MLTGGAVLQVGPSRLDLINHELRAVAESERVMDLRSDLFVCITQADAERIADGAAERAAIVAESAGCCGLVQVPTSGRSATAAELRERSRALRAALHVSESNAVRARVARMRRGIGFAARGHAVGAVVPGFRDEYVAMVTLTYQDLDGWQPRHIADEFLKRARAYFKAAGVPFRYVWVGELQKRGALHYHVAIWMPRGCTLPKPDQAGWWDHGATRIEAARDAVAYLMKYMSKGTDAAKFPKGARMHGAGGLEVAIRRARRWLGLPGFVKARADIHDNWTRGGEPAGGGVRVVGGGWSDPDGCHWPSEYARAWLGDQWGLKQTHAYSRPFEAHGPFTWIHRSPKHA